MTESPEAAALPADRRIADATLGTFVRGATPLADGGELVDSSFTQTREFAGRDVVLILDATDPAEARSLLPRLARAVERHADLTELSVEAIVRDLSGTPPTDSDFSEAREDLALDTIAVECDGDVALHFSDRCGRHFLDGYWPAVRFDADDNVVEVFIAA